MVEKTVDEKEAQKLKKIYNHYLDKRGETRKNTQFKVEDIFADMLGKVSTSPEQRTKPNNFRAKLMHLLVLV